MLDAGGFDERELLAKCGDRLRSVRRIQYGPRVWLKGDQRRTRTVFSSRLHGAADDIEMAEVDSVETSNSQRHGSDRTRREPQMDVQEFSTFSGTKVRRSGSV